ncbi:hypothetical protein APY94_03810 [Thermococcus celericrescens]|uniref:Uncharacterized protein n=1 Tax=Thermococcus celericrescens TaxID=227598 RepID=A0A100XYM9_9EURY|nr:hypothetical protein [Thermococcus celericrescens]KUH34009.1 hypothetical protein APY94_03810 [Thermococcus celericrescens]
MIKENNRSKEVFEYIKDCVEHPEEHPEHWEDWLRAGRRRFLLLNIIYYLQNFGGKEQGVSKDDLEKFLVVLHEVDSEMFSSIIKPWKSLDDTLEELLKNELIVTSPEGKYLVNRERIKSKDNLIYWKSVKDVFDKVNTKLEGVVW